MARNPAHVSGVQARRHQAGRLAREPGSRSVHMSMYMYVCTLPCTLYSASSGRFILDCRRRTMLFTRSAAVALAACARPTALRSPMARMSSYGADSPFILLARCHVKPEFAKEHLEAARVADAGVQASEPGMLHHTFDQDPDDPLMFVWSEVYANDAALLAHLANPPLQKFVEEHGAMGDGFSVEVRTAHERTEHTPARMRVAQPPPYYAHTPRASVSSRVGVRHARARDEGGVQRRGGGDRLRGEVLRDEARVLARRQVDILYNMYIAVGGIPAASGCE